MAYRYSIPTIKPIKPLSAFGTSKIGLDSGISFYTRPSPTANKLSANQLLTLAMAGKTHHRSFGDRLKGIGLGIAHPFEVTLHELLRTSTAFSSAAMEAQKYRLKKHHGSVLESFADPSYWGKFYHGAGKGFHHPGSVSYSDVLKGDPHSATSRFFKRHKIAAGVAGLGLDVAIDPLTYATLGTGAAAKAGEETAFKASKFALETGNVGAKGGPNLKAIPELQAAAATLDAAGPRYGVAAALARSRLKAIDALARVPKNTKDPYKVEKIIAAAVTETHVAERAAWAEHFNNTLRPIHVGFRLGKTSGKLNTRIPLPKVGEALVKSNTPVISNVAGKFRQAFGSGRGDWERAMRVTRKHIVEERADSYVITAKKLAGEMPKKMSEKDTLDAWHYYESAGSVRKMANGQWALDAKKAFELVRKGKLTSDQYKFLVQWDKYANILFEMDKAAGINVTHIAEKTGGGYVAHIFEGDKTGLHVPNDTVRQFLKRAGYSRQRKVNMTIRKLDWLHKTGKLTDKLETNPYNLMVKMGRQRANAQADQAIYHVITDGFGVASRIPKQVVDTKRVEDLQGRLDKVQKAIHDRTLGPISKHPKGAKAKGLAENVTTRQAEMKRLIAREKKLEDALVEARKPVTKMLKNPEVHGEMVTLKIDGKIIKNAQGEAIKIEREGADALGRYERILRDPKERLQFASAWQRAMGRWKVLVTAVNIGGYRIRNTMSDFWNMYLSGVPIRSMPHAAGLATNFMRKVAKADPSAMAEFMHLYHSGALSGVFGGDVSMLSKELELGHGGSVAAIRRGRLLKAASRAAQNFNRKAENWGRLTHYMYRTRVEGMSSSKALEKVREAHFDYEDLTLTEQSIKSKFIPFYTWTRKDVPYQISQLIQHPGRYATFPKAVVESEKAAGTEGDVPPGYLSNTLAFKVPGLGYLTPQIGVSDVARFQNPKLAAENIANMQNPLLKAGAELALNKSFFTGQPIKDPTGHARQPVSSWLAPLLAQVPGSDVGTTSRTVRGKQVFGQGASPYAMYFVNQLPLSRYLATSFNPITRGKRGYAPELSYFGGQSTTKLDPQTQLIMEQLALQDRVAARVKELRDEGKVPRASHKTSPYEKKLLAELRRQLRRK